MLVWLSVWSEVQIVCICSSWCHCHSLFLASVKSRLVLPFCYWLTRIVPEKGPLNGYVTGIVFTLCVMLVSGMTGCGSRHNDVNEPASGQKFRARARSEKSESASWCYFSTFYLVTSFNIILHTSFFSFFLTNCSAFSAFTGCMCDFVYCGHIVVKVRQGHTLVL